MSQPAVAVDDRLRGREPVVLLHGFAGTGRTWDGVLEHLPAERYRAHALDLPGHGGQACSSPYPISFEGCVASVLARAPAEPFVLCGYSMGGRIALQVALAAPRRVSALVLVSTTAGIEHEAERAARREHDSALADEIELGTIERFADRWCAQPMFAHDPPAIEALARADHLRNRPAAIAEVLRAVGTGAMPPLWDQLEVLPMPVSVLVGERDVKFRALARRLAETLERASLSVLPSGHRVALEAPTQVAAAIELAAGPRTVRS